MDEFETLLGKFEEPAEEVVADDKPTILVVDDDESMRRGLDRSLSIKYNVIAAENGTHAIEKFDNNQFFTVILDIKMPGMSGFEVCQELNKKNPDVPIIFYTAFQGEHDVQAILNIYKPFAYLDKGGKYDINQTVESAVEKYSDNLAKIRYQKELENKIVDLGLPLEETKSPDLINIPSMAHCIHPE